MKRQRLSVESLPGWAKLSNIEFRNVRIVRSFGNEEIGADKGSSIIAETSLGNADDSALIVVPKDMVLSLKTVQQYAKFDHCLREVLEAMGEFARTPRGAILLFLLLQLTNICDDIEGDVGVHTAWTDYIKYLPCSFALPTLWGSRERDLLIGTTLGIATSTKLESLTREYDSLRECTTEISWCRQHWWDEESGHLSFEDWKTVDAMFRSRALDLPGTGHAMVPCIDMANHASGDDTVALYETDDLGNGVLILRDGKTVGAGEEVTITYGDDKGASEMIFSYGFLEPSMETAKEVFLELVIPEDDPLRVAKHAISNVPPGVRVFQCGDSIGWEGAYIWLICVNEEDGLGFATLQSVDGETELEAKWKGNRFTNAGELMEMVTTDESADLFTLRALVTLQERVAEQLAKLNASERNVQLEQGLLDSTRYDVALKLRQLEWQLLLHAYTFMDSKKRELAESNIVKKYFLAQKEEEKSASGVQQDDTEEDFS